MQHLEREVRERIRNLDSKVALFVVGNLIDEVQEKYKDNSGVTKYLEAVRHDVVKNINDFKQAPSNEEEGPMAMFGKTAQEMMRECYARSICWWTTAIVRGRLSSLGPIQIITTYAAAWNILVAWV